MSISLSSSFPRTFSKQTTHTHALTHTQSELLLLLSVTMKNANEKFAKINESNNSKQKCNNNSCSNNNVANNNNNSEGNEKKIFKLSEIEGESVMLRCLHNS